MTTGKAFLCSIITRIGLLLLMASPFTMMTHAFAQSDRVTDDVNSILAVADFPLDPPSSSSGANIRVEETRRDTKVFFHILTLDGTTQQEFDGGLITSDPKVFTVNKQLQAAELVETEMDLCIPDNFDFETLECSNPVETVTIAAQWEGTGDVERRNINNVVHDPFVEHRHGINWERQSSAEGSLVGFDVIENVAIGEGGSAILFYINAKCTGSEPPACEE